MIIEHLSEQQIQQYALDKHSCGKEIKAHVQVCKHCNIKIETYQLIFTAIKEQPAATFDFNLTDNVIEKLPQPRYTFDRLLTFFILWLATFGMGLVVYLFRSHLAGLFSDMTPISAYLISFTAVSIVGFLVLDSYSKFRKQIKKLNYS